MDEKVKVTLYLSKYTVDYFKSEANKNNTKYQRMIRILLDQYTTFHDN